ncbi:MAG: GTPase HflX, partial [Actinomycetia bacterium]|nr:GTPase HflX [Actinomycetes bacterium]
MPDGDGRWPVDDWDEAPGPFDDDPADEPDERERSEPPESHRGAFGDFGGESGGLIERTFRERIVLVGVSLAGADPIDTDASLDELALLVDTAGADAVQRVHQRRSSPDPATYVGKGKALEIRDLAEEIDCDTVVFDDELTPAQQFNLEKILGRSALDRT